MKAALSGSYTDARYVHGHARRYISIVAVRGREQIQLHKER